MRRNLARYKVPREVVFLDRLPRNPTGKVLKRLLRDAYASQFHPLPERKQQEFTGRLQLGMDPVA